VPTGGEHPGDRPELVAHERGDAIHLGKGRTGWAAQADQEVRVLERGSERPPEEGHREEPGEQEHAPQGDSGARRSEGARDATVVPATQPAKDRGLVDLDRCLREQRESERRRHHEGNQHRRDHGHREGARDRRGESAERTSREEHGHEDEERDQEGVQTGASHLEGSVADDRRQESRGAVAVRPPRAQPPRDVLHIADRIIDHDDERQDQPGYDHRVERRVAPGQHEDRRHHRRRHGDGDDQDLPPREQERAQRDQEEDRPEHQRGFEIVAGLLDVGAGSEERRIDLDPREPRAEVLERRLDPARHVQRVRVRKLVDDEQ
jgi:hypothetical protein